MSELFEPIAVVGIAGRLPGARDVREYWRNLAAGRESITALSDDELLAAGVPRARIDDPAYVKMAGLVPGVDTFDAEFFAMTPREAEICDPQLRLFLEVTHEAIEDAGYDPVRMARDVAVYGACGPSRYGDLNVLANPAYGSDMGFMVLNNIDYLTTLASYKLNLQGPSMAVLTACSSSLTAVHLACRSLQLGECDAAVAGASNVEIPYRMGYRWSPGDVRSADGHCRPFDASGTGTIFTSGAGAVLLKRLGDAISDGDHVRGVIHGIGINNDGSDKVSFSAPSVAGQSAAIVDAMAMAGFGPDDIGCVEMHATGTPLGDPIEVDALARAYRRLAGTPLAPGRIPIGSVKGNIGHTIPVAGIAGLLKLLLSLEHEQIPPTVNVAAPNPRLELDRTPFVLNDTLRPWPRSAGAPRRAGLSSLGIGGTNVHLVVEEGPAPVRIPQLDRPRVVIWSGRDEAAAAANRAALAGWFAESGEAGYAEATATLQQGRTAHPVRGAVLGASAGEAARLLTGGAAAGDRALTGGPVPAEAPEVVFAFPGQGSQHARMAAGLYGTYRVFTETIDECLDELARHGADLTGLWTAGDPGEALNETTNTQPLLFAVEYALARQWMHWGVTPAAVVGHSVGELVAATVAGVLELPDALRLVALRGQAMQRRPRGGMLVVAAGSERLRPLLPDGTGVVAAVANAADQTVLAGPADELALVAAELAAAGVRTRPLRTSHAFHSPAMRPAAGEFETGFAGVTLRPPRTPVYSAATGALLTAEQAVRPEFWAGQLADPVLFGAALDAVDAAGTGGGGRIVLEVGPGQVLSGLARRHPAARAGRWRALSSLPRPGEPGRSEPGRSEPGPSELGDDERHLLGTAAELWVAGCPVDWSTVYPDERPQRISLPGYRFQRRRHWVTPETGPAAPQPVGPVAPAPAPTVETAKAEAPAGPFTVPGWVETARPAASLPVPPAASLALVLVPEGRQAALPIVNAFQQAGYEVCRVRPGTTFGEHAGEFTVPASDLAMHLDEVMRRLATAGRTPALLAHAWAVGTPPARTDLRDELDRTYFALLDLVQRAGRGPVDGRLPALVVLTGNAVDVSGAEPVVPARAALIAAARAYRLESPETACRVIDVGRLRTEEELVAELRCATTDPVVALRGTRRWLPVHRPWSPPPATHPVLRRNGVYVLTGGLGGLGRAVAKGLAGTGLRPALALLSRTPVDAADDLAEIESLGAQVRTVACDVADPAALRRALDEVAAAFGPVNGVFHLAGLAGDGMLQFRGRDAAERVLRPKTYGTVALADVLDDRPPVDFVVCFSSQAALTGMVGGADYAAANAFLDAFAAGRPGWLSIDWPGWTTVGMAGGGVLENLAAAVRDARAGRAGLSGAVPDGVPYHETVLSAATHWELDEHRISGAAVLPGTGILDLVLRAYRRALPGDGGPVTLRDFTFVHPLSGDAPRCTRVSFEPDGDRAWRVRVVSRPAEEDGDGGWQDHASGMLTAGGPAPRTVPVAELIAGLAEVAPPSMLPTPDGSFLFGPRWHNIARMWEAGRTTVVRLALAAAFAAETAEYPLHPALLDTGTGVLRRSRPGELIVPFTYRSLTWYAPLPSQLYSRLRTAEGEDLVADVDLVADDGTVVVAVEGLRMRPARPDSFGEGDEPAGDPPAETGLAPDEGVRLLLRLLASDTPAQVAVVPHHDGRPAATEAVPVPAAAGTQPAEQSPPATTTPTAAAPAGSVQDRLADIWRQVLGRSQVEPEDDFFELGGDSLMGVTLTGRIRDTFGVHMSIGSLFDYPNLAALAAALREQGAR
ncbi:SDR family NAD(P)-dependent oxidoreductase [Micromonospora sp. RTGN7]|uniref:SDR family NAD(P)-dependent oxidoreductase n=1 Tax=Micromonospora sp. RTGN7 TaxID=3016526 RepID=UPI0029FF48AC|nr:SDR family NAD(P)-dependent oxidoreductase [Micromonospora sp. RTGN7]